MAYPRCVGDDPLKYEEYDPTPFSGGYDQVALYGRPKQPSSATCYPKSQLHSHQSGGYGADYSQKPPSAAYGVDQKRPSYQDDRPPHGSGDYSSGYGATGYGSGQAKHKPSTYQDQGGYGGYRPSSHGEEGAGGYGSGHSRLKPSYEEGGNEYASGYGDEGNYGRRPGYGGSGYGDEGNYGGRPGYGGSGYGDPHRQEYGGFNDKPPSQEQGSFGYGGEGGFGRPGRFGGDNEGGIGGGSRPAGFGADAPSSYYGDEPPAPAPMDQGYGGYQGEEHQHGHHHRHHHHHNFE